MGFYGDVTISGGDYAFTPLLARDVGFLVFCWAVTVEVIKMSLPRGGHNRVTLACVCNVNQDDSTGVLSGTNMDHSLGIDR